MVVMDRQPSLQVPETPSVSVTGVTGTLRNTQFTAVMVAVQTPASPLDANAYYGPLAAEFRQHHIRDEVVEGDFEPDDSMVGSDSF
jgi:hypothetical protein